MLFHSASSVTVIMFCPDLLSLLINWIDIVRRISLSLRLFFHACNNFNYDSFVFTFCFLYKLVNLLLSISVFLLCYVSSLLERITYVKTKNKFEVKKDISVVALVVSSASYGDMFVQSEICFLFNLVALSIGKNDLLWLVCLQNLIL